MVGGSFNNEYFSPKNAKSRKMFKKSTDIRQNEHSRCLALETKLHIKLELPTNCLHEERNILAFHLFIDYLLQEHGLVNNRNKQPTITTTN